jgi:hypothetical protein
MKKRLVGGKIGESGILCAGSLLVGFCHFAWANHQRVPLMVSLSDNLEIGRESPAGTGAIEETRTPRSLQQLRLHFGRDTSGPNSP